MSFSNRRPNLPQTESLDPPAGRASTTNLYLKGSDLLLPDEPRLSVIWRARWAIAAFAVAAGLCAMLVATLPKTEFTAQATIRVSLLAAKGVPREVVLAQNDLAAQYALLASSQPVLDLAQRKLGQSVGKVDASPIDGYNIVGITTTAGSSSLAARRADAVAHSLVEYVKTAEATTSAAANKSVAPQLDKLDEQIATAQESVDKLQTRLGRSSSADASSGALQALLSSQLSLLGTLVSNRTNYFTAATRDAAAAAPQLTLLDIPTKGDPEPKRQLVYGMVTCLVAAFGAAEIAVLAFRLRLLSQVRPNSRPSGGQRQSLAEQRPGFDDTAMDLRMTHS